MYPSEYCVLYVSCVFWYVPLYSDQDTWNTLYLYLSCCILGLYWDTHQDTTDSDGMVSESNEVGSRLKGSLPMMVVVACAAAARRSAPRWGGALCFDILVIYLYLLFPDLSHLSRRDKDKWPKSVSKSSHLSRHDMTFGPTGELFRSARCARGKKAHFGIFSPP